MIMKIFAKETFFQLGTNGDVLDDQTRSGNDFVRI